MRPAPNKKSCILCQYSASNQFNELMCLFLFEHVLINKTIPLTDCPLTKDNMVG